MSDKAIIPLKQVKTALEITKKAISSRPTHPICACYKIVLGKELMTISSFDLSNGIEVSFPIDNRLIDGEKTVVVSADLLNKTISKVKKGESIDFLLFPENQLTIKGEKSETKLNLVDASEYPEIPFIDDGKSLNLPAKQLKQLINLGGYAVSNDETKQVLTGMNMMNYEGKLQVCSTNGHQLAVSTLERDSEVELPDVGVVISSSFLRLIESLKTVEDVDIIYNDVTIQLKTQYEGMSIRLIGRVLGGNYPLYHQLIPKEFEYCVAFNRQELLDSIDTATVVSDQKNQIIILSFDQGDNESLFSQFRITATTQDVGESTCYLTGEIQQGKETMADFPSIGLNATYVTLAINHIPEQEILLWINASNKPIMISGLGGGFYQENGGLVMPVQIVNR